MSGIRVEMQGQIGYGNMKPTIRTITKEKNGGHVESKFISFRMFSDDYSKPMVAGPDGRPRRQRMVVTVVLPDDDRSNKLFHHLYSGRKVLVRGDLTHRPNKTVDKSGKEIIYVNPSIRMNSLQFLDRSPDEEARKVLSDLTERLGLISKEDARSFLDALNGYYQTLRQDEVVQEPVVEDLSPDDMSGL